MSVEQPPTATPTAGPRKLSTPAYAALILGVIVVLAVTGALAKNYGPELGGESGVLIGVAIMFALACGISAALVALVGNPTVPIVSGILVALAASGVAEAAGLNDSETWRSIARFVIFFGAYFIWAAVVSPRLTRRPAGRTG